MEEFVRSRERRGEFSSRVLEVAEVVEAWRARVELMWL
jgi:hypothetical protein